MNILDDERLIKIKEYASKNFVPIMQNETAKFLIENIKKYNSKKILEIGTAIGYSGCVMLLIDDEIRLKTVEIDETRFNLAKENFKTFGFENRVQSELNDAKIFIEKLREKNEKFDFIFLDGPKGQQYKYLPILKELLNPKGILFVDDVYYHKNFIEENGFVGHKHRAMVNNLQKFIDLIQKDDEFEKTFYETDEGILVARKK